MITLLTGQLHKARPLQSAAKYYCIDAWIMRKLPTSSTARAPARKHPALSPTVGTMKLNYSILLIALSASVHLASAGCPDSKGFFNCTGTQDPCAIIRCASGTTCVVDNCGGCHARCEKEGTMRIMSVLPDEEQPTPRNQTAPSAKQCPDGSSFVNCLVNPCDQPNKPCKQGQKCLANYCGGCNAICVDSVDNSSTHVTKQNVTKLVVAPTKDQRTPPAQKVCGDTSPCAATTCLVNTICIDDLTTCTAKCVMKCTNGFGMNPRTGACQPCRLGHITDVQQNICVACPKDTYFRLSRSGRRCLACPKGRSTKGATGQLRCV